MNYTAIGALCVRPSGADQKLNIQLACTPPFCVSVLFFSSMWANSCFRQLPIVAFNETELFASPPLIDDRDHLCRRGVPGSTRAALESEATKRRGSFDPISRCLTARIPRASASVNVGVVLFSCVQSTIPSTSSDLFDAVLYQTTEILNLPFGPTECISMIKWL